MLSSGGDVGFRPGACEEKRVGAGSLLRQRSREEKTSVPWNNEQAASASDSQYETY